MDEDDLNMSASLPPNFVVNNIVESDDDDKENATPDISQPTIKQIKKPA